MMIFCPDWTNSFSLSPPRPGSILAWKGAPLPGTLADILEDLEAQGYDQGYALVWDDIGDIAQAYSTASDFEKQLRSALERVLAQTPIEQEIDIVCLYDGASWELVLSFSAAGTLGTIEVRQTLQNHKRTRSRRLLPSIVLGDDERERLAQIQRVVRERVTSLRAARAAIIDEAERTNWPESKLHSVLASRKIDTYAVADGLKLSGDYLTAWLRTRGLPNAHALIRWEKLSLAERLISDGTPVRTVALQLGFSEVDYFKRLLAEHRRARASAAS